MLHPHKPPSPILRGTGSVASEKSCLKSNRRNPAWKFIWNSIRIRIWSPVLSDCIGTSPLLSSSITPDDGDTFHWVSPDSLNYYFSSVGISINEDTKKEFKISIFTLGIPLDNIKLAEACYDEALFSYDCTFAKG